MKVIAGLRKAADATAGGYQGNGRRDEGPGRSNRPARAERLQNPRDGRWPEAHRPAEPTAGTQGYSRGNGHGSQGIDRPETATMT